MQALDDPFQFLLVLGVDVRPEYVLAGLAKKAPVTLDGVRDFDNIDMNIVFDLTMLKTDLLWSAFQIHIGPPALVEFVGSLQPRIGRRRRSCVHSNGCGGEKRQDCKAHNVSSC